MIVAMFSLKLTAVLIFALGGNINAKCAKRKNTNFSKTSRSVKNCESVETSNHKDCGFYYCEKGYDCCPFYHCMPEGSDCCGAGFYCEKGQTCCGHLYCCKTGYYCDDGSCKIYRGTDSTTERLQTSAPVEKTTRWTRSWTTDRKVIITLSTLGYVGGSSRHYSLYLLCMIPILIGIICVIVVVCRRAFCKGMVPRPRSTGDIYLTGYTERQRQIQAASNNTYGMILTSPSAAQPYFIESGGNADRHTANTNEAFSKPPPSYEDVVNVRY